MDDCNCESLYCTVCRPDLENEKCPVCYAWTVDGGCRDQQMCQLIERVVEGEVEEFLINRSTNENLEM